MIYVLYCIILLPFIIYGIYFFVLALGVFKKARRVVPSFGPEKRLAVLVAARNEENVITDLIKSLKAQAYPSHLYDIYVIPNNCSDGTKRAALAAGARILYVEPPIKTKGDVLKKAFCILQSMGYDGYVIIDADNVASPNFLQRMNDALCAGYPAAQGKREGKNPNDSWVTGGYTIYFETINILINRARMNLGRNAILYGTGMMVSASLLSRTGYPIQTLTEDMEYTMICALKGRQIAFIEDAVIFDEQPIRFVDSLKQRRRWATGSYCCFNIYKKRLAKETVRSKNKSALDILLFSFAPIFQVFLTCICLIISISTFFQGGNLLQSLFVGLAGGAAGYLAQVVFAWLIVRLQNCNLKVSIKGTLMFPLFLLSWFPLNVYCIFNNKDLIWEPIVHTRSCNINKICPDCSATEYDRTR